MKFIILLFLLTSSSIFAQEFIHVDSSEISIDSIRISGNELTKDFIILRELTFSEGGVVDSASLDFNRERIYSLGLFNQVDFNIIQKEENNILQINVEESWYFYPLPFLDFEEENFGRATYGLALIYKNFRGRNEEIASVFKLGYDPAFSMNYYNPLITEKSGLTGQVGFSLQTIQNKSTTAAIINQADFEYKAVSFNLGAGKRINLFNSVFLSSGFTYVDLPPDVLDILSASRKGIDRIIFSSINYTFDSRDLKQFPQEGFFFSTNFTHKGFNLENINYNIINLDFREYYKVTPKLATKWRLAMRHTFGKYVPYYDYSYLGYSEIVRGYKDKEREGNNLLIGSVELRYPIISEWNLSFSIPLIPKSLTSYRIAIFIKGFADAGSTFNNRQRIDLKKFDSGYGMGLTFLVLPYNALRIEYAFNDFGKGELLIGTGFSF